MTDMREEELEKINILIKGGGTFDKLPAYLMASVAACDDLQGIEDLYKSVRPFIIDTHNKLDKEEPTAFAIRLLLGIVDTISTAGYMSERVITEQNRKAQKTRHKELENEIVPIIGELLQTLYKKSREFEIVPTNPEVIERFLAIEP